VKLSGHGIAPAGASSNQVLLTGGLNLNGPLASAELFDPASCKFAAAGNMTVARAFQTATYLDPAVVSGPEAGQVLIAGGQTDSVGDVTAAAELYDPLTKSFVRTAHSMNLARAGHSATLLTTGPLAGKVMMIGGESMQGSTFKATASAEIYDPSSGTFTPTTGSMNVARSQHRATLISGCNCAEEGDVLVTGGYDVDPTGGPNDTAEVFNPASGTFACVGGSGSKYACADVMSSPR
jgi:Galactose oxidase, central domain